MAALLFFWRASEWAGLRPWDWPWEFLCPCLCCRFIKDVAATCFQGQLPDAFFFLARSLRAGLALEQSLTRAGEQMDEPLAGEFRRAASQIQLGLHPQKALQNMADRRLDLADFDIFVSTVGLYYHGGGNLALLLDRLAASARDRVQFLGFSKAATALGRTAGFVLGAAMPVLVIAYAVLEPDHVRDLFQTQRGRLADPGDRRRPGCRRHHLVPLPAPRGVLRPPGNGVLPMPIEFWILAAILFLPVAGITFLALRRAWEPQEIASEAPKIGPAWT